MEQLRNREAREAEVYKRELMTWFKEQKKEQDQSRMLEEHTAKERFKVTKYAQLYGSTRQHPSSACLYAFPRIQDDGFIACS